MSRAIETDDQFVAHLVQPPTNSADDSDHDSTYSDDDSSSTVNLEGQWQSFDGIPHSNDEPVQNSKDRLDAEHTLILLVWNRRLYNATVIPKTVLNVGAGTGAWAMHFGRDHPESTVIGSHSALCQPSWVHSNVEFQLDRLHQPWTWRENLFDFVCVGNLNHNFADKEHVCTQAFRCAKPGGLVEIHGSEFVIRRNGGSTQGPAYHLSQWSRGMYDGLTKLGRMPASASDCVEYMRKTGFEQVESETQKVPIGDGPADNNLEPIRALANFVFTDRLLPITKRAFVDGLGWEREEVEVFSALARNDIWEAPCYYTTFRIWGRKPALTTSDPVPGAPVTPDMIPFEETLVKPEATRADTDSRAAVLPARMAGKDRRLRCDARRSRSRVCEEVGRTNLPGARR